MLTSRYFNIGASDYENNDTISTMPIETISIMPIFNYIKDDWVAPEYEGVYHMSPYITGLAKEFIFSDKDDDIYVWYGDFSQVNDGGIRLTSTLNLNDGKNVIKFSEYVEGLTVWGGDDEDHIHNARHVVAGGGDDLITVDGIDLSDGTRPWSFLRGRTGDDTFILKDTTGTAHISGGKGEDYVKCSLMSIEHILFSEGDSLKEDGTLGEDTVELFYPDIDIIRFSFEDKSIGFDDIVQTLSVDEDGENYINVKVEDMDVNINIYTYYEYNELLIEKDFIFQ